VELLVVTVGLLILVVSLAVAVLGTMRSAPATSRIVCSGPPALPPPGADDLQAFVRRLIATGWGPMDRRPTALALDPATLTAAPTYDEAIRRLLGHVREVSPRLAVPQMVPRVRLSSDRAALGLFREQDGWVTIAIDQTVALDGPAAHAVLCHEVCHYILGANGIREENTLANERLTDSAVFVFGLGWVFVQGRQSDRRGQRTRGGYLTDAEYQWLGRAVSSLWSSGEGQLTAEQDLERKLAARVINSSTRRNLVDGYARRFPHLGRAALLDLVLDELDRDYRR